MAKEKPKSKAKDTKAKVSGGGPFSRLINKVRESTSLTTFVSLVVLLGVLVATSVCSNVALSLLSEHKLKDVWAILFLEMEQVGVRLSADLRGHLTADAAGGAVAQSGIEVLKDPQIVYRLDEGIAMLIAGSSKTPIRIQEMGLNLKSTGTLQVTGWSGATYVARIIDVPAGARLPKGVAEPGRYVLMWNIPIKGWLSKYLRNTKYSRVYSATREGLLLFSNSTEISQENFEARTVVQYFIRNQFGQVQSELLEQKGEKIIGFCYEVPHTNIVLFGEVPKGVALKEIRTIATFFLGIASLATIVTILLVQIPLGYIRRPMRDLIRLTQRLGSGDFSVVIPSSGFGEIRLLASSFSTMARSLEQRDKSIRSLLVDREQAARLQKEMEIAKGIQDSLLPGSPLNEKSGIAVAAKYIPADEVAGDWYHYHYWEETGQSVIVIADVSGHGAGSSIFTAITAELFEDVIESCKGSFPMALFAETLNRRIFKFGKGGWHCTLAILKFTRDSDDAEFMNAGHPPMIFKTPQGEDAKLYRKPGNPVGLSASYSVETHHLKLPKGSFGILFSDGLIEAKGSNNRAFGTKKLIQILSKEKSPSITGLVDNMMNQWRKFSGKTKQADDICIIGFKRVS